MPISCDPSTLANLASCFSCTVPVGEQMAVQTYLLAQLALSAGAISSADPSTLANAAVGFLQTIPIGEQMAVQNYLLCQLVNK